LDDGRAAYCVRHADCFLVAWRHSGSATTHEWDQEQKREKRKRYATKINERPEPTYLGGAGDVPQKGGKFHEVPAHHTLEDYLDAYIQAAGSAGEPKTLLFRSANRRSGRLTGKALRRNNALDMVKRRANGADFPRRICCHTFCATGITAYLEEGGIIEKAQQIAFHESPKTTKLYDRTLDQIDLDEIERIRI
jgi:hypothetical protein